MRPETRQFIQLLKFASAPKYNTSVNTHDIITALNDFEWYIRQVMLCEPSLQTLIADLEEASAAIAAFIYTISHMEAINRFPESELLIERLENTYGTLITAIHSFQQQTGNDTAAIKLLPFGSFGKLLTSLQQQLSAVHTGTEVYNLFSPNIASVVAGKTVSFHNWLWWSHFYYHAGNALQANKPDLSGLLMRCNFNCPAFINLLITEILNAVNSKHTFSERLDFITGQLLKYKLMASLVPHPYFPGLPSIKKTIISLLKKQIQALPAGCNNIPVHSPASSNNFKVPVNVPVSQLALFIRLFIEAGIIKSDNHTELLKNMAPGFATPKTSIISPDSLRVNFYAPPQVAKNIVKDYLVQMMARLRTIEG